MALVLATSSINKNYGITVAPPDSDSSSNANLLPGQAYSEAKVTIHSTHKIFQVHYSLYLDDLLRAHGNLATGTSIVKVIPIVFPANESGSFKTVILATSTELRFWGKSDQAVLTVSSGEIYPLTLNV